MRTIPLSNVKRAIDDKNLEQIMDFAQSGLDIERDIIMGMPGWDALHYAVFKEDIPITRYLLVRGANPNARDAEGFTTLHIAARTNNPELIRLLIDHGADVHAETVYHWTPLHDACLVGNLDTVIALVERGADIDATTDENKKPIDIAKENGHDELVAILKDIERQSSKTQQTNTLNAKNSGKGRPQSQSFKPGPTKSLNNNSFKPQPQSTNNSFKPGPTKSLNNNSFKPQVTKKDKPSQPSPQASTPNSGRLFDKLDRAGKNYFLSDNTEYIGDNVLPTNGRPAEADKRYFFDTKDTKCEILRAFDADVLEGMKKKGNNARNPYTRRQWPLEDVSAMKRVLKKVPSDVHPQNTTTPATSNNTNNHVPPPSKVSTALPIPVNNVKPQTPTTPAKAHAYEIAPTPTYVTHNKKTYKLRSGERGGQYILVKGKRVYLPTPLITT